MNPLVNTDVHRYVKDLIDRHIPKDEGVDKDKTPDRRAAEQIRQPDTRRTAEVKEGEKA